MGRGELHIGFWLGNIRGRDNFEVPMRRWEDNIKLYGRVGMDQIDLFQDRNNWWSLAKTVINNCVSYYAGKFFDQLLTG